MSGPHRDEVWRRPERLRSTAAGPRQSRQRLERDEATLDVFSQLGISGLEFATEGIEVRRQRLDLFDRVFVEYAHLAIQVREAPAHFVEAPAYFAKAPTYFVKAPTYFVKAPAHFVEASPHFVETSAHFVETRAHFVEAGAYFGQPNGEIPNSRFDRRQSVLNADQTFF